MKYGKKLTSLMLALVMTLAPLPAFTLYAAEETQLTILGTTDLHGNIWGYSYEDSKETENNGIARVYTYVQGVRAENPNTILIDNGDTIQGTILTDDIANKNPDEEHPVMSVMNYMGYDALTLGNHEFNWGIPTMLKILSQADFPILSANTRNADGTLLDGIASYTIVERDGVNVAIIGVTTPNIQRWDGGKDGIDDLVYGAASVAVTEAIAEIGDKADLIVVSAHMGLYAEYDEEGGADSAQKIIDDNPEVDVLMVGHYHIVVNETEGQVVIGGARNSGRDVVRFDLTVDGDGNVTASTVDVVDMTGVTPSEEIRSLEVVKTAHEATIDLVTGGTDENGEGGVALGSTTAKFQPENEIDGIPQARLEDTAVLDLINKIQLENSGADVSSAALFKDTSDLPEGDINYGNVFDIYKYDNTLCLVTVTGAELKAYMEWSAQYYNQWVEGDVTISFNADVPGYRYDTFAGVDYEIDLSQPVGSRIKNVMFKGELLADDQELQLAVNNYRYSSALKSEGLIEGSKSWESSNSIRDMIVEYFANNSPVEPEIDNNWKIVGVDLQLDNPDRATLISLVNSGAIETPYNKSININDPEVKAILENADSVVTEVEAGGNVSVNGEIKTVSEITIDGVSYYRLRDLANALSGTTAQFDVDWDGNNVQITSSTAYSGDVLDFPAEIDESEVISDEITVYIDGNEQIMNAASYEGHYYIPLTGTYAFATVEVIDGVLTIIVE